MIIFFAIFFAKTKICSTFALAKRNIGLWCNGNTTDSGPVILGSNPGSPTQTKCNGLCNAEVFLLVNGPLKRYFEVGCLLVNKSVQRS